MMGFDREKYRDRVWGESGCDGHTLGADDACFLFPVPNLSS